MQIYNIVVPRLEQKLSRNVQWSLNKELKLTALLFCLMSGMSGLYIYVLITFWVRKLYLKAASVSVKIMAKLNTLATGVY